MTYAFKQYVQNVCVHANSSQHELLLAKAGVRKSSVLLEFKRNPAERLFNTIFPSLRPLGNLSDMIQTHNDTAFILLP